MQFYAGHEWRAHVRIGAPLRGTPIQEIGAPRSGAPIRTCARKASDHLAKIPDGCAVRPGGPVRNLPVGVSHRSRCANGQSPGRQRSPFNVLLFVRSGITLSERRLPPAELQRPNPPGQKPRRLCRFNLRPKFCRKCLQERRWLPNLSAQSRGRSSVGRALPCQGRCREFESLRPLSPLFREGSLGLLRGAWAGLEGRFGCF